MFEVDMRLDDVLYILKLPDGLGCSFADFGIFIIEGFPAESVDSYIRVLKGWEASPFDSIEIPRGELAAGSRRAILTLTAPMSIPREATGLPPVARLALEITGGVARRSVSPICSLLAPTL